MALAEWLFLMRYVHIRMPRFERGMVTFLTIGTVILFLLPASDMRRWTPSPGAFRFPVGHLLRHRLYEIALRNPTRSRILIAAGMFAQIAPALHDLLWLTG